MRAEMLMKSPFLAKSPRKSYNGGDSDARLAMRGLRGSSGTAGGNSTVGSDRTDAALHGGRDLQLACHG